VDKDVTTISSVKKEIQDLKKRKEEALAAANEQGRPQLKKIRKKIKRLKRLTRALAHKAGPKGTEQPIPAAPEATPAPAG
jgi:ElaB/YqjD/DUF883 family membrane-anchored ribosome-binding protein